MSRTAYFYDAVKHDRVDYVDTLLRTRRFNHLCGNVIPYPLDPDHKHPFVAAVRHNAFNVAKLLLEKGLVPAEMNLEWEFSYEWSGSGHGTLRPKAFPKWADELKWYEMMQRFREGDRAVLLRAATVQACPPFLEGLGLRPRQGVPKEFRARDLAQLHYRITRYFETTTSAEPAFAAGLFQMAVEHQDVEMARILLRRGFAIHNLKGWLQTMPISLPDPRLVGRCPSDLVKRFANPPNTLYRLCCEGAVPSRWEVLRKHVKGKAAALYWFERIHDPEKMDFEVEKASAFGECTSEGGGGE